MAAGGARSLAGGAVVETRLCARVLGLKLLVVDGVVTLWPAQAESPVRPGTVRWGGLEPGAEPAAGGRLGATAARLEATADRLRQLTDGSHRA